MHFLIDSSLPRGTGAVVRRAGHQASDVRDLGLGSAADELVAQRARDDGLALITADFDFADIRFYPPQDFSGIVVIDRPDNASVAEVLEMVASFLDVPVVLAGLPGRLAIVDRRRIRLRPALSARP